MGVKQEFVIGGKQKISKKDQIIDLEKKPRSNNEARVIKELEKIVGFEMPTVNPSWLIWERTGKTLELDGYNATHKLAIEFSGPMHYKWYPSKETYAQYYERIARDQFKRKRCEEVGVQLIIVESVLSRNNTRDYLLSRLYDFGRVPKPARYMPFMSAIVYRDPILELQYNLNYI